MLVLIFFEFRCFLCYVIVVIVFGGGFDGFDLGVISVVILYINYDFEFIFVMEGFVGVVSLLGIFIGVLFFGFFIDKFGCCRMFFVDIIVFIVIGVG